MIFAPIAGDCPPNFDVKSVTLLKYVRLATKLLASPSDRVGMIALNTSAEAVFTLTGVVVGKTST